MDGGRIRELAERQHGSVSWKQLQALGVSSATVSRRSSSGEWLRVLPGVYRLWKHPDALEQRLSEAVLWAGDGAAASHSSAAYLLGLEGYGVARVEIIVPAHVSIQHEQVMVHRPKLLTRADLLTREWPPRTEVGRTLADLSDALKPSRVERTLESAWRKDKQALSKTRLALSRLGARSRKGLQRLRQLVDSRLGEPTDSELEAIALALIRSAGFPDPTLHERLAEGFDMEGDFIWEDEKVVLMTDGFEAHGPKRQWLRDKRVRRQLFIHGWQVVEATWNDMVDVPHEVVTALRASFGRTFCPRAV